MKTAKILVYFVSFIAASYYVLTALLDYFSYETVTSVWLAKESAPNLLVICSPKPFSPATHFDYVKSFLGISRYCHETNPRSNASLAPYEAMMDSTFYSLQHKKYMPWHLSRLTLIYSSYPIILDTAQGMQFYITFDKLRSKFLPAPYDTDCREYEQYECIYNCTQGYGNWTSCVRFCSKPGCESAHLFTLSHTAIVGNISSQLNVKQGSYVKSTSSEAKMNLEFIILNVLGLLGVFFGFSVLNVTNAIWRLMGKRWTMMRKILKMSCRTCALVQCFLIVADHMKYPHLTETIQGVEFISLPKTRFSICLKVEPFDKPWDKIVKPKLNDVILSLGIARYKTFEVLSLHNASLKDYASECTSTYSVDGVFCFLLATPEKRFGEFMDQRTISINFELTMTLHQTYSFFEISAQVNDYDIMGMDPRIEVRMTSSLQNTYYKVISLPHPYSTNCQRYGQGQLQKYKSRRDCVNACALRRFKLAHPGQHAINIPIFNDTDTSYIAGDAGQYLASCEKESCRWTDCEEERFTLYTSRQQYSGAQLGVDVSAPQHDAFQLRNVPVALITDTLLILISTVGFWTGVSMLQILGSVRQVLRALKAKRSQRKAFKKFRHIFLAAGMLWNTIAAMEMYFAYESLSQAYSEPASQYSPFSLVLLQPVRFSSRFHYSRTDAAEIASRYSELSLGWIGAILGRRPGSVSWIQQPIKESQISSYLYYEIALTELKSSYYVESPAAEELIASGSMELLKIDIISTTQELAFFVVEDPDLIDIGKMVSRLNSLYPRYNAIYKYGSLKVVSLSAPHSDCIEYTRYGYKTKKDCYYSCLQKRFFSLHNATSSRFQPIPLTELWRTNDSAARGFLQSSHVGHCLQLCGKPECYWSTMYARQNSRKRQQNGTSITVNAQTHETSIKQVPKMNISQFIMYLGNTLAIWYGLCVLDLIEFILHFNSFLFESSIPDKRTYMHRYANMLEER
ncbi:hypothetical protein HDE_00757 [Halotydeus destructor]|nr:hypothetical protein HDE_00757 [Halotydeus destructor]